jgi:hypothetical protein
MRVIPRRRLPVAASHTRLTGLWEQLECLDVRGPQDAEVLVVERREPAFTKSFDESENACVNHSERLVVVMNLNVVAAREIGHRGGFKPVGTGEKVLP